MNHYFTFNNPPETCSFCGGKPFKVLVKHDYAHIKPTMYAICKKCFELSENGNKISLQSTVGTL